MSDPSLAFMPATELAARIRTRELSPVEVTEALLARIEALDPRLNAYRTVLAEEALAEARQAEQALMDGEAPGPLHGVPVSIKDMVFVAGAPCAAGSVRLAERIAPYDSPVVSRLRAAGAVITGKTTMPEGGWKGCSESPLTGITHNPWGHGLNAGGSSSGAAVAAAAGMGPLHQGSDGGGSIRMPASLCGVYGFRPSTGRIPNYPVSNNGNMSTVSPLARTVADAALFAAATAGAHPWDPHTLDAPPPVDAVQQLAGAVEEVAGLRLGYAPTLGGYAVDPPVAQVVADAVGAFAELGCQVEEIDPDIGSNHDLITFLWSAHRAGDVGHLLEEWGSRMDPAMVACARDGLTHTAADYQRMQARRYALHDRFRELFERYDALVTPTLSVAAFPAERIAPPHYPDHPWDWIRWAGFCYPANLCFLPAASLPAGFTAEGLPVGLQVLGPRLADMRVLQLSAAFEQVRPWAQHRPPEAHTA